MLPVNTCKPQPQTILMLLWLAWWNLVLCLRPAFSRYRAFLWFAVVLAAFSVRGDLGFPLREAIRRALISGSAHETRTAAASFAENTGSCAWRLAAALIFARVSADTLFPKWWCWGPLNLADRVAPPRIAISLTRGGANSPPGVIL